MAVGLITSLGGFWLFHHSVDAMILSVAIGGLIFDVGGLLLGISFILWLSRGMRRRQLLDQAA
jgi:hypothetical protein